MMPIRRTQTWLPEVLLNDLFNDSLYGQKTITSPALNILEKENGFCVELAVPGMTKEDIKVDVNKENQLVISAEKKTEKEDATEGKSNRYLRKEFGYTQFVKILTLPDDVDKDLITASYDSGILAVEIPRKAKALAEESKSIAIL
jgi:HSP20 family protein